MRTGLASAVWPARLQKLTSGHLRALLPEDCELWLDGGHNPQGGQVLGQWLSEHKDREIYLVCGMIKGKDSLAFMKPLAPHVRALYAITIPGELYTQASAQIAAAATQAGMEAQTAPSLENALQTIAGRAKTPAIICICGSLYLAGKVLANP
jgi:dihydrofolate synthase/folylpolyglutamate synthase